MRLRKRDRRILKSYRRRVLETRTLMKRCLDTHHRWRAIAEEPTRTPHAAILIFTAKYLSEHA